MTRMRRKNFTLFFIFISSAVSIIITMSCTPSDDQVSMMNTNASKARSYLAAVDNNGMPLAMPDQSGDVVHRFLETKGVGRASITSLALRKTDKSEASGFTYRTYQQELGGKVIYGTQVHSALDSSGALVMLNENLVHPDSTKVVKTSIEVLQAFKIALKNQAPGYDGPLPSIIEKVGNTTTFEEMKPDFAEVSTVTSILIPMSNGGLFEGYDVTIWGPNDTLFKTLIGGPRGQIIRRFDLTASADYYFAFPEHPVFEYTHRDGSKEILGINRSSWSGLSNGMMIIEGPSFPGIGSGHPSPIGWTYVTNGVDTNGQPNVIPSNQLANSWFTFGYCKHNYNDPFTTLSNNAWTILDANASLDFGDKLADRNLELCYSTVPESDLLKLSIDTITQLQGIPVPNVYYFGRPTAYFQDSLGADAGVPCYALDPMTEDPNITSATLEKHDTCMGLDPRVNDPMQYMGLADLERMVEIAKSLADPNLTWIEKAILSAEILGDSVAGPFIYAKILSEDFPNVLYPHITNQFWDASREAQTLDFGQQMASTVNAFYHVNATHDRLAKAGFNEAAGNFQRQNFDQPNGGGDMVTTTVLTNFGLSRKRTLLYRPPPLYIARTFVRPEDGTPAHIELGGCLSEISDCARSGRRNSAFDSDIILHEYHHLMFMRLVGPIDAEITLAVNEGLSDFFAMLTNNDPVVGEYVTNVTGGLRGDPRDEPRLNDPTKPGHGFWSLTYSTDTIRTGPSYAHANSRVLSRALWDWWAGSAKWNNPAQRYTGMSRLSSVKNPSTFGFVYVTQTDLREILVEAEKILPPRSNPAFEDVRKALLVAMDTLGYGKEYQCTAWNAFADRGIGIGANALTLFTSGIGDDPLVSLTQSFVRPAPCCYDELLIHDASNPNTPFCDVDPKWNSQLIE